MESTLSVIPSAAAYSVWPSTVQSHTSIPAPSAWRADGSRPINLFDTRDERVEKTPGRAAQPGVRSYWRDGWHRWSAARRSLG